MISKSRGVRRWLYSLCLVVPIAVLGLGSGSASPTAQATRDDKAVFNIDISRYNSNGGGNLASPDLVGTTQVQAKQRSEEKKGASVNPASGNRLGMGDPENGKAIFMQEVALINGGQACIGCHNIDDQGILGGGALGPDLTQAATRYGEDGLASVLADIPFPTMQPIYADQPLTVDEQADLAAFIKSTADQQQVNKEILILVLSLAGFLAAMALGGLYWRRRLPSVRQHLLEQAQSTKRHP